MSYYFPEGSKFYFSTTFAAAKTITALTNAGPAVATSVAHGFADNDELLIASGWDDVNDSVYKADQLTADTFSLVDLDTSDINFFPAGSGIGSARKISGWTEIPQILDISTSGGDPKFATIAPLSRRNAINQPIGFNPESLTLKLGWDPANANYKTMLAISRVMTKCAFKQVISGGAVTYGYGYMIVSERPQLQSGNANTVQASLSLMGRSISYA